MASCISEFGFDLLRRRFQDAFFAHMPEYVARLDWDAATLADHQRDALRRLLRTAIARSQFHARRLAGVDPDTFELADLPRLPVLTKDELMGHFDEAVTDRRLTRALIEDTLSRTATEPIAILDEYSANATGGSSGTRGVFVGDVDAFLAFACSIMRPTLGRMMVAGGDLPPGGLRIALVAAASAVHSTGGPPAWLAGTPFRFASIPVTLPVSEQVERLNALDPHMLFGYPGMLACLAREQQAGRLHIRPQSISSTSERLLPEHRAEINRAFSVPIVNVFGSTEGLAGISAPDEEAIVFNTDVCFVELLDAAGDPVAPGVPSARVLITNLENLVQPLIRYELTDRFVRLADAPNQAYLRALVEGRVDEAFHYGNVEIQPHVVRSVLLGAPAVVEYQVRQSPGGVEVDLIGGGVLDLDGLQARLVSALAMAGLPEPVVVLCEVPSLAQNAQSGKIRRFVPIDAVSG